VVVEEDGEVGDDVEVEEKDDDDFDELDVNLDVEDCEDDCDLSS
jgi:hypothetical protein